MTPNPPNPPSNSLFQTIVNYVRSNIDDFIETLIHGTWSEKIIAIACFLFICFSPEISLNSILTYKGL
jgi:hypothetical protein